MEKTWKLGIKETLTPSTVVEPNRFVGGDGNHCGVGQRAYAVSYIGAEIDEPFTGVLNGICLIELGGTVTVNDEVESDADGKAVVLSTGKSNGVAGDSGVAGDIIRISR